MSPWDVLGWMLVGVVAMMILVTLAGMAGWWVAYLRYRSKASRGGAHENLNRVMYPVRRNGRND